MYKGNVVKWNNAYYIVSDADLDNKLNPIRVSLIPIDYSNSETHISKKHPFLMKRFIHKDCETRDCECEEDCCPYEMIPNPALSISKVKFVADNVRDFILTRVTNIFFK